MYNVRFIEYPTGYQIRVYTGGLAGAGGHDFEDDIDWIDYINGDIKLKDRRPRFPTDVFIPLDESLTWEGICEDTDEEMRRRAERSAASSMARTVQEIYRLARSNVWEWFLTLTVAPSEKLDRYDYDACSRAVRKFFDNLRQRKAPGMYYLIVPERHKDGAWHFHGLLGGSAGLTFTDSGHEQDGERVYNFENWKSGFSTATRVEDTRRVSSYISKYITKDLCAVTKGKRRYWASATCKRAEFEDYLLDGAELKKYREKLMDNMSWKTARESGFYRVEYFEIPKDGKGRLVQDSHTLPPQDEAAH